MQFFTETLRPNGAKLSAYLFDESEEMKTASVRPAVLIFPGGGYTMCSDREAEPVALAYMGKGFNAFVLRYSVGAEEPFEHSLQDAEAALDYLRENAERLHINAQKIAAAGFSAGGHLAASLGTVSREKPNALILGYAVTTAKFGPLMGKEIAPADECVSEDTPPTFLFATSDDCIVPVENSLSFAQALAKNDIYFELHVYLAGPHGISLATDAVANGARGMANPAVGEWLDASARFLRNVWGGFPLNGTDETAPLQRLTRPSVDMAISRLMRNPAAAAVVEKYFPAIQKITAAEPIVAHFPLRLVAQYSQGLLDEETLRRISGELEKLP